MENNIKVGIFCNFSIQPKAIVVANEHLATNKKTGQSLQPCTVINPKTSHQTTHFLYSWSVLIKVNGASVLHKVWPLTDAQG